MEEIVLSKPYFEKLKDPRWQKKRLGILERADWKCEECARADQTLHVHHTLYIYGKEPWEYRDEELKCLCEECHEARGSLEHDTNLEWKRLCAQLSSIDLEDLMGRLLEARQFLTDNPKAQSCKLELICDMARHDWTKE